MTDRAKQLLRDDIAGGSTSEGAPMKSVGTHARSIRKETDDELDTGRC